MKKKIFLCLNIIALAVFLILVCFILSAEYIRFDFDTLGDFGAPIQYGYAFYQGGDIISSPMGFIYSLINGLAFIFLDKFHLGINKIVFTASLFFSVGITAIWILIRRFTQYKIPFIVLLLIVLLTCNPTSVGIVLEFWIRWNGQYNVNLYMLIFLEMILSALIFSRKDLLLEQKDKDIYILSAIYALFLYIPFNYKISYFAAASFIAVIPALVFSVKKSIKYFISIFIFFVLANVLTALISGYDYFVYFEGLYYSAQTRLKSNQTPLKYMILALIDFTLIMGIIVFNKFISFIHCTEGGVSSLLHSANKKNNVFVQFLSNFNFKNAVRCCLFAFIFVLSIYTAVSVNGGNGTEGGRVLIIPLVISFFVFWKFKYKKIVLFAVCLLYIFYIDILYAKLFVKPDMSDYKEIVYNNINSDHKLRFFLEPQKAENKMMKIKQKYNIPDLTELYLPKIFDDIINFYKKFGLTADDTIFAEIGSVTKNIAPFIVNGKYPKNAMIWDWADVVAVYSLPKDLPDIYKEDLGKYDIFVIQKIRADAAGGQENVIKKYILQNKNYEEIYQTQDLIFYAKKSWIKDRGIIN
ncbi:MAG: hypothetical protein LBQ37_04440 [Elusimicrobiota bacterium]|jgi:hypothetical protein|nr:hypothetical protein [Elusimicrobiota bacterium]